jgi:phage tail tape-measure protein
MKWLNKFLALAMVTALVFGASACTNMTKTQQNTITGAAGGALVGAIIGAIAGGKSGAAVGAAIGGAAGELAVVVIGNTQETNDQYPPPAVTPGHEQGQQQPRQQSPPPAVNPGHEEGQQQNQQQQYPLPSINAIYGQGYQQHR